MEAVSDPIRTILVDDQALVRAGLQRIFSPVDGFEVVAECSDGAEAIRAVVEWRPDLVCMDIRMRGMDGIAATAAIRELDHPAPVLILTTFDDDEILWGALQAGAAGFIMKDASAEDLIRAATVVAAGGAWLDPQVTPRVLEASRRQQRPATHDQRLGRLTDREIEVLRAIATGATNAEIAERLFVSETTVKSHVGHLFAKLEVRDRAAAIIAAFRTGLVDPLA